MITKVNHSCVIVSDLDKSLAFYRDVLGLKLLFTTKVEWNEERSRAIIGMKGASLRIALLQAGDDQIELIQYITPKGKPYDRRPYDIGNMHIAFQVIDLHRMYEELKKKGVKFYTPPNKVKEGPFKGHIWCYCSDPDGALLELVERR